MKIRKGFVSNSSSSSFICDVTGEEYTSMDASLEDADMYECENGHTFCREFLIGEISEDEYEYEIPAANCPICTFEYIMESDIVQYIKNEYGVSQADVFAFMKAKNSRLRKVRNSYYFEYLTKTVNKTKEDVVKEIKEKYSSFDEFRKKI